MTGKPRRSSRQHQAIISLASGQTVAGAAKHTGVSPRTISRWLGDPEFVQRVDDERRETVKKSVDMLGAASNQAVLTLIKLMGNELPTVQLGAARAVLDSLLKLRNEFEIERRLSEIEKRMASSANVCGPTEGEQT